MKLSEYAKNNNMLYMTAYRQFKAGKLTNAVQTKNGSIVITDSISQTNSTSVISPSMSQTNVTLPSPVMVAEASDSSTATPRRRNASSTIVRTDRFKNIEDGLTPFKYQKDGQGNSNLSVRDAILLTQLAYYNFSIFRNVIDLMTEFSTAKLYFTGGNDTSKTFFEAYFDTINMLKFEDSFFREYYRSGNVFIFSYKGLLSNDDIKTFTQIFKISLSAKKIELPLRYVILNPADIVVSGSASFVSPIYQKTLSDYELEVLKNPRTPEDKKIFDNLPEEARKAIKNRGGAVLMPLDNKSIYAVFYKKQDYEGLAVPMGYPVLEDINWKAELKRIDMAISRTVQQAVLLVTTGTTPQDGGISGENIKKLQEIFQNESVGRVLVADYTTKAMFVIPDISALLDPKKYEVVDRDIKEGLNNILMGSTNEKFANRSINVQLFIERLNQGREVFLNEFLKPEIKRISQELGFKNYPTPHFVEFNLKDELEYARIFTRLAEIGILTPEETINAINDGILPTSSESLLHQTSFKDQKDKGLYLPVAGGPYSQLQLAEKNAQFKMEQIAITPKVNGRPPGTKKKQSTKRVKPMGGSLAFSGKKIIENIKLYQNLSNLVTASLLEKFKLKELDPNQKNVADEVCELVMANENPENWAENYKKYVENPVDTDDERIQELNDIKLEFQIGNFDGCMLLNSKM